MKQQLHATTKALISMPEDLLAAIDELCEQTNVNRSTLVCTILRDFIDNNSNKKVTIKIVTTNE